MSPKQKNSRARFSLRRVFINLIALLLLGALAAAVYAYIGYRKFADTPIPGLLEKTTIDVPIGTPLPGVITQMQAHGLQPGFDIYWRLLARELGVGGKLHAGEYELTPELTPRLLLKKMAAGDVIQHKFTIVEGWTFAQLRQAIAEDKNIKNTIPAVGTAASADDEVLMERLGDKGVAPEGQFLPETYGYVKGMSDVDILRRAHDAMRKAVDKLWAEHTSDSQLTSPYQALILASVVEKETGRAEERPQIARVFLSRLKLGMKLQTDPSVIYGLGAQYNGKLHRSDLDTDTPYNTYTRAGLPPTPIALPGRAALEAVIHPADTEALYFVARGDGTHEFSPSLEAHNRAVAKYQLHR